MAKSPEKNLWEKHLPDGTDIFALVKPEHVVYLLDHRAPFIQVVNGSGDFKEMEPIITTSRSDWPIVIYGVDAICSSPGEQMFGSSDGEGDFVYTGKGTIINQSFITTEDIVKMAIQKNWSVIDIVNGTPIMKRALWIIAGLAKIPVSGFSPTSEDETKKERLLRIRTKLIEEVETYGLKYE